MREQVGGGVRAAAGDGDCARAEVARRSDVVGRVADDDELRGREFEAELSRF